MQKKIVHRAPVYMNGEHVGTYKSVTYIAITEQEVKLRLAGIAVVAVIVMCIVQSII